MEAEQGLCGPVAPPAQVLVQGFCTELDKDSQRCCSLLPQKTRVRNADETQEETIVKLRVLLISPQHAHNSPTSSLASSFCFLPTSGSH